MQISCHYSNPAHLPEPTQYFLFGSSGGWANCLLMACDAAMGWGACCPAPSQVFLLPNNCTAMLRKSRRIVHAGSARVTRLDDRPIRKYRCTAHPDLADTVKALRYGIESV